MKISIVVISTLLVVSVFLPLFLLIYNGTKNTTSIKKQLSLLIKDNGIVYGIKEIWRKKFIGISNDHKILSFINASNAETYHININIKDIKQTNVIKTYHKDTDGVVRLKNLSLELVFKPYINKNLSIPFFNIDDDLLEDFEIQRIEKWHSEITKAMTMTTVVKIAS